MTIHRSPLKGIITVPGDKSISHRAIMFGALAEGTTEVTNFLQGADCLSTIRCFRQLGIGIENDALSDRVVLHGKGLHGLHGSDRILDIGNSGTTMRLLSGILSGQDFPSILTGDESIKTRPMGRIITPLKLMGADIISENDNGCAPLLINSLYKGLPVSACSDASGMKESDMLGSDMNGFGRKGSSVYKKNLHGIHYISPVASAQVKSCVLLAGLFAEGETSVTEPSLSRNHTELMLSEFGATVKSTGNTVSVLPEPKLTGRKVHVPGDISSAAYFIVAGLIVPDSELVIRNVGINPTRDGILKVCRQMGADIILDHVNDNGGEPVADLIVRYSSLHSTEVGGSIIPTLIDDIPVIAVLACFAEGDTVIKDASELKVKESNRIDVMVDNLTRMGADITATEDGMVIHGGRQLHGAIIDSKSDHRIAMSFAIAALMTEGDTKILHPECVDISYPGFYSDLLRLQK